MKKIDYADLEIYKVIKDKRNDKTKYIIQLNGRSVFLELYYRSSGPYKGSVWWNRLMIGRDEAMRDMLYREMEIRVRVDLIEQVKFENCPKGIREAIKKELKEENENN